VIYAYAFLAIPSSPLTLPLGMRRSVEILATPTLAAAIEPAIALEELQQTDASLMQAVVDHDRVIQTLFQQITVLPLRFGTCFASHQTVLDHLIRHEQTYQTQLTHLASRAEYVLRLMPLEPPELTPAETSGKAYFLAKKQQYQQAQVWQQQQQQQRADLLRAITEHYEPWQLRQTEGTETKIYLLLQGDEETHLHDALLGWQGEFPGWQLALSAPLPPYHFLETAPMIAPSTRS